MHAVHIYIYIHTYIYTHIQTHTDIDIYTHAFSRHPSSLHNRGITTSPCKSKKLRLSSSFVAQQKCSPAPDGFGSRHCSEDWCSPGSVWTHSNGQFLIISPLPLGFVRWEILDLGSEHTRTVTPLQPPVPMMMKFPGNE